MPANRRDNILAPRGDRVIGWIVNVGHTQRNGRRLYAEISNPRNRAGERDGARGKKLAGGLRGFHG
jgi:hypothetical protein